MTAVAGKDTEFWGWDATMFIERIRELEAELARNYEIMHAGDDRLLARAEKAEALLADSVTLNVEIPTLRARVAELEQDYRDHATIFDRERMRIPYEAREREAE